MGTNNIMNFDPLGYMQKAKAQLTPTPQFTLTNVPFGYEDMEVPQMELAPVHKSYGVSAPLGMSGITSMVMPFQDKSNSQRSVIAPYTPDAFGGLGDPLAEAGLYNEPSLRYENGQFVDPEAEALIAQQNAQNQPVSEEQTSADVPSEQEEERASSAVEMEIEREMNAGLDQSDPMILPTQISRMYELCDKYANAEPQRALEAMDSLNQNYRARLATGPLLKLNNNYTQNLGE